MSSQQELTKIEKYYKELKEIDNYWILKLIKIILSEAEECDADMNPKIEKIPEGGELSIAVTIDRFPKNCQKYILNKSKKISWTTPVATVFYYKEDSNTL